MSATTPTQTHEASPTPQRQIIARPLGGGAVHTITGSEAGQRGPWSLITDTPHSTHDMVGPPALYLAVAAWAA